MPGRARPAPSSGRASSSASRARPTIITIFESDSTFWVRAPVRMPAQLSASRTSISADRGHEHRVRCGAAPGQSTRMQVLGADERDAGRARALQHRLRPVEHEREHRVVVLRDRAVLAAGARHPRADLGVRERARQADQPAQDPHRVERGGCARACATIAGVRKMPIPITRLTTTIAVSKRRQRGG